MPFLWVGLDRTTLSSGLGFGLRAWGSVHRDKLGPEGGHDNQGHDDPDRVWQPEKEDGGDEVIVCTIVAPTHTLQVLQHVEHSLPPGHH